MKQDISYKNILRISVPMIVSGLATNLVSVIDTIFITRLGHREVGGAGNGILFYLAMFLIGMGFTTAVQIIVARRNGEGKYDQVGQVVQHGAVFLLVLATLLYLLGRYTSAPLLHAIMQSQDVLHFTDVYLNTRSWGIFFTLLNLLFTAFLVGTTHTRILGFFTPVVSVLNIALDNALIYGEWGLPALGVQGAALASNISEGIGTVFLLTYIASQKTFRPYGLLRPLVWSWDRLLRVLRIGAPVMLQNLLSLSAWMVFFVIVEHLGERELAVSHIIRSIYIFIMVPIFAFADATNSLVSNLLGQGEPERVFPLIYRAVWLGWIINLLFLPLLHLFPEALLGLYTQDEILIELAVPTLLLVSWATLTFTVGMVLFRAVSGTGNTRAAMWMEIVNIIIYLSVTYTAVRVFSPPLYIVWSSEFLYFSLLSLFCWLYLKRTRWQQTEV